MSLSFRPMRLVSRRQETPDTFTQDFLPLDGKPFINRPGQFTVVRVGDTGVCRPYTVSSTYGTSELRTSPKRRQCRKRALSPGSAFEPHFHHIGRDFGLRTHFLLALSNLLPNESKVDAH